MPVAKVGISPMSNLKPIYPLDRAKIPTHRSSFDLSSKKLFTAKVGEILPCYWQIAIPNTKYRISSDWFTRTVPVTIQCCAVTFDFSCASTGVYSNDGLYD